MAHQVIPAIIAANFSDLEDKINKVKDHVEWIQLDVMDGRFVDRITWYNPQELKDLPQEITQKVNFEAHLMVYKPERLIEQWLKSCVKRIYFHFEATHRKAELVAKIKDAGIEAGLALDIVTPYTFIESFISQLDAVLIMTVRPGKSGQKFREDIISKIKNLHQKYPDLPIAVDGGINPDTAKLVLEAGATMLCSGSYVLESADSKKAIETLRNIKI